MPFPRASKALARFTVLDLTRVRSGPTCVRQLADWGANVIKIETPPGVEEPMGGPREGGDFQNLHRNKRSMTLNLKKPEGIAALKRMVKKADVLVENFRPDVKKRLGIDYKTLSKVNPKLIYASISGFGQDGPYANRPGFDQIAQGMGGLMSVTGLPGQGPVRVGIPIADLSAGLLTSLGILRCSSARNPKKANRSRAHCCKRRFSCSTSRPRDIWCRAKWRSRPATIIRPARRLASTRLMTATSISPLRVKGSGNGSAK
jgi:crotonobetainyl-CoA:carnitine CoA-transferase CaiB-like acyl-CoA transferase